MRQREFKLEDMPPELLAEVERVIADGEVTRPEVDEALMFMNELADQELRGEVTPAEAMELLVTFTLGQAATGRAS